MTGIFFEHIIEGAEQMGIPLQAALEKVRPMGYEALECDLWRLADRQMKITFDDSGLSVVSLYHTYDFPHETSLSAREKYLSHLETAAFYGAGKILCVPGFIERGDSEEDCMKRTAERLSEMCAEAAGYNITVTIEDYDDINSPCCTVSRIDFLLKNVPPLMFTFDTGNFAYALEDVRAACERFFPRIAHVHLKDRLHSNMPLPNPKADLSGENMYPCAAGEGYIGIADIVRQLRSKGYKGDCSVEHFGAADQFKTMENSLKNLNSFLA
ncbi:MAG: sugar phosphate isomerase/epimerase [Ruminococcus sp.]|nr:sugar phosphate isomerase/epimerase [Ruminococcus sp.]